VRAVEGPLWTPARTKHPPCAAPPSRKLFLRKCSRYEAERSKNREDETVG
jgi:hypothetical protein